MNLNNYFKIIEQSSQKNKDLVRNLLDIKDFFYDDKFYLKLEDLLNDLGINEKNIENLSEDWEIECNESNLETIEKFSSDWIVDRMNEDRFTENGYEIDEIIKILEDNINFEKINNLIPKLYYINEVKKFKLTKI